MDEKELKALLEKMFGDYQKGILGNEDFIKSLSDIVKGQLTDQFKDIETLKSNIETLTKEIKNFGFLNSEPSQIPEKLYNGVWGSASLARDFGLYVLSAVAGSEKATEMLVAKGYKLERDFNEQDNTEGGIFAPTQFIDTLIMLIDSYGKFRQNVNVYPMSSDSASAPMLTDLLEVYCPSAGVAATKSDAGFKPVGLGAKEWVTYCAIDKNLDEDAAISIGNLVGELIAMAFALKEDTIGFNGDGTSTYFNYVGIIGKLNATASLAGVVEGTGSTWASLTMGDFSKLLGRVPEYADDGINLKWYCTRAFYFEIMEKLALAAGGTAAAEILTNSNSRTKYFRGYEVVFIHVMPKVTAVSQICCVFGNLKLGVWLGDRRKMTIESSTEALFTQRQIAIMGTERIAITVFGEGTTTVAGPICALKTKAS
ncbi:MAG: phage major capsid protein [Planctomycetes bacterium]|nr:phage major capsid protein [Planctomycetota bacterium]